MNSRRPSLSRSASTRKRRALRQAGRRAAATGVSGSHASSRRWQRGKSLNLTDDEVAFYDALADHPDAEAALGIDGLRAIALELVGKLRKNASVDWQQRESVRARLRNLVRVALRRHGYPPDKQPAAIELVMEQAERLTNGWTSQGQ